jgi:SAM-dependent methyltransferase
MAQHGVMLGSRRSIASEEIEMPGPREPNLLHRGARSLVHLLPQPASYALRRQYHRLRNAFVFRAEAQRDPEILRTSGFHVAPPPHLRLRTHGHPGLASYLDVGKTNFTAILAGISLAGRPMAEVRTVLDFGCGCGRTLQWWLRQPHPPALYGTDVDAETVAWVKANLPVHAGTNAPTPPLAYADGQFDMVYSISVFTHLDATFQDAWLKELNRVIKPGGLALFSVRSAMDLASLPPPLRAEMEQKGLLFRHDDSVQCDFPEFYHSAYHSPRYIEQHWGAFFAIVGRLPMGQQDLIVMKRP